MLRTACCTCASLRGCPPGSLPRGSIRVRLTLPSGGLQQVADCLRLPPCAAH
jgi:hypothetical protein